MNSSHTQVCTRTLPSASFGSVSGWPWLPRPGTDGEPRHLHFVPTLGPLPAPQQQRGSVPADAEVMEPLVSGARGIHTPSVVLWGHLCFRLLAFPFSPSFLLTEGPRGDTGSHYQLWSVLSESTAYPPHSLLALGNFALVLD